MIRAVWVGIAILTWSVAAVAQTAPSQTIPSQAATDGAAVTRAEIRELIDAAKATAKASRENVDYARVVPDILFQILTKLDKIEDKLDRIENLTKAGQAAARKR